MGDDKNQKKAFDFLAEHLDSQELFTKEEFESAINWTKKSFDTYWSKQFKSLVVPATNNRYRVSDSFRRIADWNRFQQHVTQVRRVASTDYKNLTFENVLTFEFFMPLSNEAHLRTTLDTLFYKDTLLARLNAHDEEELFEQFPKNPAETKARCLDRLCDWLAPRFVGYSISHVSGRFRAQSLSTRKEVADLPLRKRYLIDETTAVTRFIFPCKDENEANKIRWFFETLFVKSIIQLVNGEDEIWMVESGSRNRVYIWRVEPD
jgi:hypothetical protein